MGVFGRVNHHCNNKTREKEKDLLRERASQRIHVRDPELLLAVAMSAFGRHHVDVLPPYGDVWSAVHWSMFRIAVKTEPASCIVSHSRDMYDRQQTEEWEASEYDT